MKKILIITIIGLLLLTGVIGTVNSETIKKTNNNISLEPLYWTVERPATEMYQKYTETSPLSLLNTPPSSFDLRDVEGINYVPSVKRQSGGTCWAHAVYACMEGNLLMTELWENIGMAGEPNLAEYHLDWWNGFNNFFNDDISGSDGVVPHNGAQCRIAAAYLSRGEGAVFSEDANDGTEQDSVWYNSAPDRYDNSYDLYYPNHIEIYDIGDDLENIDLIKTKIMDNGPITILFRADTSLLSDDFVHYQPVQNNQPPNHNVVIIGWDDEKETPALQGPGAWLCKNSWGSSWGNDGYFWISYYDKYCGHYYDGDEWTASFQEVEPMSYERVYYHDYHGWQQDFTLSNEAFNVFTAENDEVLTAVSFFTCTDNVEYEVKIFETFNNGELQNELSQASGHIDFTGFHTVQLDTPALLNDEDEFYIYLKLSDGGLPYDQTTDVWGYTIRSHANPGESYYLSSAGWTDLYTYDTTANFCIKGLVAKNSDIDSEHNTINLVDIKPGSQIDTTVSFRNNGEHFSKLYWEIIDHPDWGAWSFSQESGGLFAEFGTFNLDVSITAPTENNMEFSGDLIIANMHDTTDVATIQITLATTKTRVKNDLILHLFDQNNFISNLVRMKLMDQ